MQIYNHIATEVLKLLMMEYTTVLIMPPMEVIVNIGTTSFVP